MSTTLTDRICSSRLSPLAPQLMALMRPAIRLDHIDPEPDPALGASRFGGLPDVPSGFRWPRRHRPLAFLLQIDLATVSHLPAAVALPAAGMLSFFYDATGQPWGTFRAEQPGFRAYYTPPGKPLRRIERLPKRMSPEMLLPASGLSAVHHDTLPACPCPWPQWADSMDIDDWELEEIYRDEIQWPDQPAHQMLGYPRPIQRDLFGLSTDADSNLVSLLELDSHPCLGVSWGDAGKLHWLVPRRDLVEGRLDRLYAELQCC